MPRRKRADTFVAAVAPIDDQVDMVRFTTKVADTLRQAYANYELVLVDNGSSQQTLDQLKQLLQRVRCVRIIRLSRHYDLETSIFAGLEASIGDYVVALLPGYDKPDVIPKLVERLSGGTDIVFGDAGTRRRPGSAISGLGRRIFYWYSRRFLNIDLPPSATYLLGLNRKAVNALTQTQGRHRHVRQLSRQVGFNTETFTYTPLPQASEKRGFFEEASRAMEIAVSYSRHPLRFVSWLGFFAGLLSLGYGGYSLYIYFFTDKAVKGWTSLSLILTTLFFLVFLILIVLSEYIGRILEETRQQPPYHVMEELVSREQIANSRRRNVAR